jgi:hypothetical protein
MVAVFLLQDANVMMDGVDLTVQFPNATVVDEESVLLQINVFVVQVGPELLVL